MTDPSLAIAHTTASGNFNIEPNTINDIVLGLRGRHTDALMSDKRDGQWMPLSAADLFQHVLATAYALEQWGIRKGDRVAILSENRSEWMIADFGILMLGAVVVPVYATQTAEQTAFLLQDAGVRIIFVSSVSQFEKVQSMRSQTAVEKIVVMDEGIQWGNYAAAGDSGSTSDTFHMRDLLQPSLFPPVGAEAAQRLEATARSICPDDLATIIYTSGTTGVSKGAMLTHGNLASNIRCSLHDFGCTEADVEVSFLPLAHITALHVDYAVLCRGVHIYYCPDINQLTPFFHEVRPTFLTSVPRIYEKVYQRAQEQVKSPLKQLVYRWAMSVGRKHLPETLRGDTPQTLAWNLADKLLFSKVRAGFGGRARILISGGAPLGRELAMWCATLGIRIHQGYGLTETSPVISVNTPAAFRLGSSGKPLANVQVRIAADGEILARGPSVFRGYWKRPDESREAFDEDWFKTGDIGYLDEDGFLFVTDRKKNLIKTSGGKFIAPQPIENSLKLDPLVGEAVVLGDRRKFAAVLIVPNFEHLEAWAAANGINLPANPHERAALVSHPAVQAHYEAIVSAVNARLARFEKLKKTMVVAEELTPENGMLTTTLKLRRRAVEEHFQKQIDELYQHAEGEPHE